MEASFIQVNTKRWQGTSAVLKEARICFQVDTGQLVSKLCTQSIPGILCDPGFWILWCQIPSLPSGGDLVPNMIHSSGSVTEFTPLGLPLICGVTFHYNDGIMSFQVGLWSIFPPSWNDLVLTSSCVFDLYDHCRGFLPQLFPLIMHGGGGPDERT